MIIRDIKDDIKKAIYEKGFNDGVMQVLHVSTGYEFKGGEILLVGINNDSGELMVLVADAEDNHSFYDWDEVEEDDFLVYCKLTDEILYLLQTD